MLLENLLPFLPESTLITILYILAVLGGVLLTYGVFLEQERRQDLVKFIGAACLFIFALYKNEPIFAIAMAGLGLASLVEFIEIYLGLHKHSPEDLKRYKKLR